MKSMKSWSLIIKKSEQWLLTIIMIMDLQSITDI